MLRNQESVYEWLEHSAYHTKGEADNISHRLELFTSKPTKVVFEKGQYWIMIGRLIEDRYINRRLYEYNW